MDTFNFYDVLMVLLNTFRTLELIYPSPSQHLYSLTWDRSQYSLNTHYITSDFYSIGTSYIMAKLWNKYNFTRQMYRVPSSFMA